MAALTIATIPTRIASGSLGQTDTTLSTSRLDADWCKLTHSGCDGEGTNVGTTPSGSCRKSLVLLEFTSPGLQSTEPKVARSNRAGCTVSIRPTRLSWGFGAGTDLAVIGEVEYMAWL